MNSTITNMSVPHIWGFDRSDTEMRVARQAGWRRSDLVWERLMETANIAAQESGAQRCAWRLFRTADLLARLQFSDLDLRRAATAANMSILSARNGGTRNAEVYQRRALSIWQRAPQLIEAMQILPRSRSSLFHLRMEALHRDTYHGNLRTRIGKIADETRETLAQLTAPEKSPHRHYARWRGERPTVFDDTRKVLGACLLIMDF